MIDEIDLIALRAELGQATCELSHGPYDHEPHQAVDFLVIPVGKTNENGNKLENSELVIPVCQDCVEALTGDEWTLLYCLDCNESQWVLRAVSRLNYRHHIIWLKGCPHCGEELRGIYFSDEDEIGWDLAMDKVA